MVDTDKSMYVNKNWLIGVLVTVCGFLIAMGISNYLNQQRDVKAAMAKNHEVVMKQFDTIKEDIHNLDKKVDLGDFIDSTFIDRMNSIEKRVERLEDGR